MEQFLKVVAKGYQKNYPDISRLTFVMPNKRSGSFLMKQFYAVSEKETLAPRIITISDLVEECVDEVVDTRLDLLFRLYESYRKLKGETDETTFEKFCSWGETLLGDFNEVDIQMVDVDALFRNVADLNYLKSNFLTDEQKAVMVEYFGYDPSKIEEDSGRLWRSLGSATLPEDDG